MSKKWKNKNFFISLKNALNGILYVLKNERNLKIQLVFAIFAIAFGIFLKISLTEWAIVALIIFMVIFSELLNTAIEVITDMITEEYNEKAKIVKDIAAGGVTIVAISSIIIGSIIYLPKLINLI